MQLLLITNYIKSLINYYHHDAFGKKEVIMSNYYDEIIEGLNDSLEHAEGTKKLSTHKVVARPVKQINAKDVKLNRNYPGVLSKQFVQHKKRSDKYD